MVPQPWWLRHAYVCTQLLGWVSVIVPIVLIPRWLTLLLVWPAVCCCACLLLALLEDKLPGLFARLACHFREASCLRCLSLAAPRIRRSRERLRGRFPGLAVRYTLKTPTGPTPHRYEHFETRV